jgi:hypothetical protein
VGPTVLNIGSRDPAEILARGTKRGRTLAAVILAERVLTKDRLAEGHALALEVELNKAGGWVDIVWWADRAAAEAAMKVAADSPVCHSYFQLMSGADHANPADAVLHFDRVAS